MKRNKPTHECKDPCFVAITLDSIRYRGMILARYIDSLSVLKPLTKSELVLMLLIHCLLLLPLFVIVCAWSLFCNAVLLCPFRFCNHLAEVERAGCFTLTVFLLSCD